MIESKDLAAISLSGKDPYEKFELSLPFCRTLIKTYCAKVYEADRICGEKGFVTLDELRNQFNSPAWAAINDDDSKLTKVLLSAALKDPEVGHQPNQIDTKYLICYGLLLCGGTP